MRDEVARIMRLVKEGKLAEVDAAELVDAIYASERRRESDEEVAGAEESRAATENADVKEPLRRIVEQIERFAREGHPPAEWREFANLAKDGARRGLDAVRQALEDAGKGKVNLGWLTSSETREVSLPISLNPGKTVRVDHERGDIRIEGGHELASVTAVASFRAANLEEAKRQAEMYTLVLEETDQVLTIRQPEVAGMSVDLVVKVPSVPMVEVKLESGDLAILNTGGGARVTSRSGDVDIRRANGVVEVNADRADISVMDCQVSALTIENKSGDVDLAGIEGNVNVRTAGGQVAVRKVHGSVIALESVQGDVSVELDRPFGGTLSVRTVSGDAQVSVPDGCDVRVSLSTLRGEVETTLELADAQVAEQRVTGRLGAGTGTLDVSAVTGDVRLHQSSAL
jgi:DUF4097 and DUF4098 domain-containing protein YvlB/copper chaperone CopZ